MTKRRAENILLPEISSKRCFRSLSNTDKQPGGVNVIQNINPPSSALSINARRCRKRPKSLEDQESQDTDNLPRKVPANRPTDENTCRSRNIEDAAGPVESNKHPEEDSQLTAGEITKEMRRDEDLSAFNSFQFWRVPLPELDLSLLETKPSAATSPAVSSKDLEAMET